MTTFLQSTMRAVYRAHPCVVTRTPGQVGMVLARRMSSSSTEGVIKELKDKEANMRANSHRSRPNMSESERRPLPQRVVEWNAWNKYLANGRGSEDLFKLIDDRDSGRVAVKDVIGFFSSINYLGVKNAVVQELSSLADSGPSSDQKSDLDLDEFRWWLVRLTKFSTQSNPKIQEAYFTQPSLGSRAHHSDTKLQEEEEDEEGSGGGEDESVSSNTPSSPSKADPGAAEESPYTLNASTMSQSLRRMQYAVRGEVVMRADALKAQGKNVIFTNVGNPHAVGQKPLTFFRQVLALCDLPAECGVDHPNAATLFPPDAIARAKEMRSFIGEGGTGAYTNSQGIANFRQDVADYISARDGHESHAGDIFLTNGASSAIQAVLTAVFAADNDALMIPIPQYPIYSALVALLGGRQVGYDLDESQAWAVTEAELEQKLEAATERDGLRVKALALINPGNPTGQVMSRESLETVCRFCAKHGIVLLADEVYQRNVYADGAEFVSAKKVAVETPGCEGLQLVSFHSTSKGLIGECGRRGGYMELHRIDPFVQAQLYKLASSGLCAGVAGQVMTSLMCRPPQPGDASFDSFSQEEDAIFSSLKRKAKVLVDGLNAIEGVECEAAQGAMYAFPRLLNMPPAAIEAAAQQNVSPDQLYALSLLERTGLCVVPASGFGQAPGRFGFRTTFLPNEDELSGAVKLFADHHAFFCEKWASPSVQP